MKHSLIMLAMIATALFAQDDNESSSSSSMKGSAGDVVITSGDDLISVGFDVDNWNDFAPGVSAVWDHGVGFASSFTLGAKLHVEFNNNGMYLSPAFRGAYHPFAMPVLAGKVKIAPVFDPYISAAVGPRMYFGDNGDIFSNGAVYFDWAAGVNWMFAENIGLWGELGRGFTVGITFKL